MMSSGATNVSSFGGVQIKSVGIADVFERNQEATIYVGNLDPQVDDDILWELFTQCGPVRNVSIPRDKLTGNHQGFGFVEFEGEIDAEYALKLLSMVKLYGKPMRLNKAAQDKKTFDVGANLFIGNLDAEVDEKALFDTFSSFGTILSAKVMRDVDTGVSKGFGFVSYDNFDSSDAALAAMNGQFLCNRPVHVSYAYKKDSKGERHGTAAERLLAANRPQSIDKLPIRPPPSPINFAGAPTIGNMGACQSARPPRPPQAPIMVSSIPGLPPLPIPPHLAVMGSPALPPGLPAPPMFFMPRPGMFPPSIHPISGDSNLLNRGPPMGAGGGVPAASGVTTVMGMTNPSSSTITPPSSFNMDTTTSPPLPSQQMASSPSSLPPPPLPLPSVTPASLQQQISPPIPPSLLSSMSSSNTSMHSMMSSPHMQQNPSPSAVAISSHSTSPFMQGGASMMVTRPHSPNALFNANQPSPPNAGNASPMSFGGPPHINPSGIGPPNTILHMTMRPPNISHIPPSQPNIS